jgi:putative oxidoreductase
VPEQKQAVERTDKILTWVDWTLRLVVAAILINQGFDKFGSRPLWIRVFAAIGIGQWFRFATGVIEVAGAVLLLFPRATFVAVPVLVCTMVGAFLAQVFIIGLGPQTVLVAVLFTSLLAIGWRRAGTSARLKPSTAPPRERVGIA